MSFIEFIKENSRKRPWWMNGLMLFCAYMTFVYVPWDFLSKPIDEAEEVWFGIVLTGMAAKATEPLHWFIYFNGMRGFWRQKTWMHPWAALYTGQIAFGMLMWNINDPRGSGLVAGVITATPFLVVTLLLWREKFRFRPINLGLPA